MKLHNQIILLSMLTLSLPWAGCEYIREMEKTLRQGQEKNLLSTTNTIAHVLSYESEDVFRFKQLSSKTNFVQNNIYAYKISSPILLDGYADDWGEWSEKIRYFPNQLKEISISTTKVGMLSAVDKLYFYLFVKVFDTGVEYTRPSSELFNGDRFHIVLSNKTNTSIEYVIQTTAPGRITASTLTKQNTSDQYLKKDHRIQGQWQDTTEGYNIELRIPLSMINKFINLVIVDTSSNSRTTSGWYGTWNHLNLSNNGLIIQPSMKLKSFLDRFKQENTRLRIIDIQNWLLASSGTPYKSDNKSNNIDSLFSAILSQIYQFIMGTENEQIIQQLEIVNNRLTGDLITQAHSRLANTSWHTPKHSNNAIVSSASPIIINNEVVGVVIADQSNDAIQTLTNHALSRLISLSTIAIFITTFGLLGYMTILSFRIRKLRNATEQIISPEGQLLNNFEPSNSKDELGDLSRSFYTMNQRLNEYTQYLRSLASTLSHELRTPLAIVQSSLDNLDEQDIDDETRVYLNRAQHGKDRLNKIIDAMSEASRVEQSIKISEPENFDLCQVVSSSVDAYTDLHKQRIFTKLICDKAYNMSGSPELIIQMLDKLIDNAIDFSTPNSKIIVSLNFIDQMAQLIVSNDGPVFDVKIQNQLFESMVSIRKTRTDNPHLGMGLYIVKLITEAHNGTILAKNRKDLSGVEFQINFFINSNQS